MKEYNVTIIGQSVIGTVFTATINTKAKNSYEAIHTTVYARPDPLQDYKADEFAVIISITCVEVIA